MINLKHQGNNKDNQNSNAVINDRLSLEGFDNTATPHGTDAAKCGH